MTRVFDSVRTHKKLFEIREETFRRERAIIILSARISRSVEQLRRRGVELPIEVQQLERRARRARRLALRQ